MPCRQLTKTELRDLLDTNPGATGFPSEADCEEECGVCCVPVCNFSLSVGGSVSWPEPTAPPGACAFGITYGINTSTSTTAPGELYDEAGNPIPYPWKEGFPDLLSTYSSWRWVRSRYAVDTEQWAWCQDYQCPGPGSDYEAPPNLPGNCVIGFSKIQEKWALFACADGLLVDITSDALDTGGMITNPAPVPPEFCQEQVPPHNILDFDLRYSQAQYDPPSEEGCFSKSLVGGNLTIPETYTYSDGTTINVPQNRPPLPNEQGAAGITYTCNDTIGRSGCLNGGGISPQGTPAGIWHGGQECANFDCNP